MHFKFKPPLGKNKDKAEYLIFFVSDTSTTASYFSYHWQSYFWPIIYLLRMQSGLKVRMFQDHGHTPSTSLSYGSSQHCLQFPLHSSQKYDHMKMILTRMSFLDDLMMPLCACIPVQHGELHPVSISTLHHFCSPLFSLWSFWSSLGLPSLSNLLDVAPAVSAPLTSGCHWSPCSSFSSMRPPAPPLNCLMCIMHWPNLNSEASSH